VCPLLFVINNGKQGNQLCCRVNDNLEAVFVTMEAILCFEAWLE
jgi:hypothetical protein